jgi:AAA domain
VDVELVQLDDVLSERVNMLGPEPAEAATTNGGAAHKERPSRRLLATSASDVEREDVEWLEHGRVPIGLVTVVAGIGGLGKSQWTCLLAARLSRGELGPPGVTLLATAEDSPSTTVRPRLEALQANLELVRFLTIATPDGDEDGIAIPDDVPLLEERVRELQARLLVIDPLVAHLPAEKIDSHRDQSVRRALAPLYRLATNTGCAVVVVLHLNKSTGLAPLMRLGASVAFGNAARSVLLLDRDPDDPEGDNGNQRVLAHIKCNVARLAPSLLYEVQPIVLEADGTAPMVETSRLELLGESTHDGRSLLAAPTDEDRTAIAEAIDFLTGYLTPAGTRHLVEDATKDAKRLGIHERTLQRARIRIGAKTAKAGFTRGHEWWLPTKEPPKATTHPELSPSSPSPFLHEGDNHLAYIDEGDNTEPPHATLSPSTDEDIPC